MTAPSDRKLTIFMWVVGIFITLFVGVGLKAAFTYGQVKAKVQDHEERISKQERRTVDYIYVQDLITSNYMMIDIMKATSGTKEMKEALKTWKDFQISTIRRANPTRGGSASSSNGMK